MKNIVFSINKKEVYQEIAQTTSYTGAKMIGDKEAYDRISIIDEDESQLERFLCESCASAVEALKKFVTKEDQASDIFTIELELSPSFDDELVKSMQKELFSYFVMSVTSKWYAFTNKEEAGDYSDAALSFLEGVRRKAYYKRKPTRPIYKTQ